MIWLVYLGYIKPWIIEQRVMKKAAPNTEHITRAGDTPFGSRPGEWQR